MVFKRQKANVIKASYRLMQKVGMGPISEHAIQECEDFIKTNDIDYLPWALQCMRDLNDALLESIAMNKMDEELRNKMTAPIMQLKASGTMFRNAPLTELAGTLLHFLECIPSMDKDVLDIVKANEVVLSAFLRDPQTDVLTPPKKQLVSELKLACNRYATKNGLARIF